VGYVATSVFSVSLVAALLAGMFGSFLGIGVASSLAERHGAAGGAALAEANGIASAVGVVAPLAIAASIHLGFGWRPATLLTIPLVATRGAVATRQRGGATAPPLPAGHAATTAVGGRLPRAFWSSWLIVVLCVSLEFSMTLWSPLLIRARLHVSPGTAATAITAVLLGMSAGRFIGARLSERRAIDWILLRSFGVVAVGFTLFWVSSTAS